MAWKWEEYHFLFIWVLSFNGLLFDMGHKNKHFRQDVSTEHED